MKKTFLGLSLALAVCISIPASAALQYDFTQTIRTDADGAAPTDFSGRALLDGSRSRVDFISGNAYPAGTYMMSTDGSRKLIFVDPGNKTYTEINTSSIVSTIGTSNIKIDELKADVEPMGDKQTIAGLPTEHYRLTVSYTITVTARNMPLKLGVRTVIDQWTTSEFGDVVANALAESELTGNQKVDELIAAETTKIKGFPLRQRVQMTTTNLTKQVAGSELKLPATSMRTKEMIVTAIKQAKADPVQFAMPAGFRRLDRSQMPEKAPMQVLDLDGKAK
jgi:hypothetical protein